MKSAVDESKFIELVNSGMRNVDIANELSLTQQYVSAYKSKLRLQGKLPKANITIPKSKESLEAFKEEDKLLVERICPACKKVFYRSVGWAYKRKNRKGSIVSLCTYGCCRKVDKGEVKI